MRDGEHTNTGALILVNDLVEGVYMPKTVPQRWDLEFQMYFREQAYLAGKIGIMFA